MKKSIVFSPDNTIYPGHYVPLFSEAEVASEIKHAQDLNGNIPPAVTKEFSEAYTVSIFIPGMRREDFLLTIINNVLTVSLLHKEHIVIEGGDFQWCKSGCSCFERSMEVPENADTEFISAEYKAGVLQIYLPKTSSPVYSQYTRIVVY